MEDTPATGLANEQRKGVYSAPYETNTHEPIISDVQISITDLNKYILVSSKNKVKGGVR